MLRRNDNGMLGRCSASARPLLRRCSTAAPALTRKTLSPSHQAIADLSRPLTFTRNPAEGAARRIYSHKLARERPTFKRGESGVGLKGSGTISPVPEQVTLTKGRWVKGVLHNQKSTPKTRFYSFFTVSWTVQPCDELATCPGWHPASAPRRLGWAPAPL